MGTLALLSCFILIQTIALQCQNTLRDFKSGDSTVRHINAAEVRSIDEGSLFDPERQREVYWHDPEWKIDLEVPSPTGRAREVRMRSNSGTVSTVELPSYFQQIDEILRTPGDQALVVEEDGSTSESFAVIDLKAGKLIAQVGAADVEISPNRRFVFFQRWVAPYVRENYENTFGLYDVLKSPQQNVCGYSEDDPKHAHLELARLGFPVYPQRPGQTDCKAPDDLNDNNQALKFSWAEDSTRFVFADVKSEVMTLVLVIMPTDAQDLPKTLVYQLVGSQDVCRGATDASGDADCGGPIVTSLGWEGDSVVAVFRHQFGTPLDFKLIVPVSQFVPIRR